MKPFLASAFAGVIMLMAAPLHAQQDDRKAIETIIAGQATAWEQGDAAAFSRHVLPGCVFTNTVGMVMVGPEPFKAQHAKIFASIYKNTRMKQTVTHFRFLAPTVAIVDTSTELAGSKWLPPGALVRNGTLFSRLEQVFVKTGDTWGITSFHNVFVADVK